MPLGTCNPGTLGSAFDWAVRLLVDPHDSPTLAVRGFSRRAAHLAAAISGAWDVATAHSHNPRSSVHREILARAAWAMALGTEVYRLGRVVPGSPLRPFLHGGATVDQALALAPDDAVLELGSLLSVARRRLLPRLTNPRDLVNRARAFDGCIDLAITADTVDPRRINNLEVGETPRCGTPGVSRLILQAAAAFSSSTAGTRQRPYSQPAAGQPNMVTIPCDFAYSWAACSMTRFARLRA